MAVQSLEWIGETDGFLEIIDQRELPMEFVKLQCRNTRQVYESIQTLAVRGAPAIGVAAAYGLVLGLQEVSANNDIAQAVYSLEKTGEYLSKSRPTAVNLFWAIARVVDKAKEFTADKPDVNIAEFKGVVLAEARKICEEDIDMCRRIGANGEKFIKDDFGVLTHCNAGALATAGQGTALAVIFEAHRKGKKFKVYADETRPLLQGARLTAWELKQAEIDVTVICDNMAGWLMRQGKINAVITGADRITANGDAANKIGTYSLSVLAGHHNVPFYIAAPSSTFDLSKNTGAEIPIEERCCREVTTFAGVQIAPDGVDVYNPAFDVTPAENIAAIITEKGVIEKPTAEKIAKHLQ